MLLSYSNLFSRVLGRIYDPKELSLEEEDLKALYIERLHNIIGNPRVSNIFSLIVLHEVEPEPEPTPEPTPDNSTNITDDTQNQSTLTPSTSQINENTTNGNEQENSEDNMQDNNEDDEPVFTENTIEYELKDSRDEFSDEEYVLQVLTTGMVIEWLRPKVDSVLYVAPMIGGKEEKKILDGHKDMMSRLDSLEKQLHKLIRDRGYIHNSYIKEYEDKEV